MKANELRVVINKYPIGATFRQNEISGHFPSNFEKRQICRILLSFVANGSISIIPKETGMRLYRVERHDTDNLKAGRPPKSASRRKAVVVEKKVEAPAWAASWQNVWKGINEQHR